MNSIRNRTGDIIPDKLKNHDVTKAYYGIINEKIKHEDENSLADLAIAINSIIEKHRIVHWIHNIDVQNRMRTEIEDILFEFKDKTGKEIALEQMDSIMDQCIDIARIRRP
jgi:type I restriction enzyme R subunit